MRIGLNIGYWGARPGTELALAEEADRLGYATVWAAEAYGSDVVTILSYLAGRTERIDLGSAVLQMAARTPATTAMTTITLDHLSGGRVHLGLGVSGPQVVEGWHGRPYGKPLGLTREYVSIVRAILAREAPVTHQGEHFRLPWDGEGSTGLGKPLRSIVHPLRADVPVYLAALGLKNVALAAEIAEGWMPTFVAPHLLQDVWGRALADGFARSGDPTKADRFRVVPVVRVVIDDDISVARNAVKPMLALYIGGMGARGANFYHQLATGYGYGEAADTIQELYLSGRQGEAMAAVPDDLVDEVALVGPVERVRDRLEVWREAGCWELSCGINDVDTLRAFAGIAL